MHVVIVKSLGFVIDINTYNSQEIGLSKALVKRGFTVSLILPGKELSKHIVDCDLENKASKFTIYYVPFVGVKPLVSKFIGLEKLLEEIKPDVLQFSEFNSVMSLFILYWGRKNKVKNILIQGPYDFKHKPVLSRIIEKFLNHTVGKYILSNSDILGHKSNMAKKYLLKFTDDESKMSPSRIGLDYEKFENYVDIDWRDRLKINTSDKVLLYIGILEQRRNVDFLIRLLEKLNSNQDNYHLVIVGSGIEESNLKKLCSSLNVQNNCHFVGKLNQTELPSLYKTADLFLLPTSYEIYGMVILESMYFNTPVISTLNGGSDIIIKDNINGFIIEQLDTVRWSEKIISFFTNKKLSKEVRDNLEGYVINNFSWESISQDYVTIYNKVGF